MKIRCIIGSVSVRSQPHLLERLGLGLGPVSWHAISRAKRHHRLQRRRRARCERRHPHHRSVAALCRQPADSSQRGADGGGCRTLSHEHAMGHALSDYADI